MTDVDDYFGRLEAALKARESAAPAPAPPTAEQETVPAAPAPARLPVAEPSLVAEAFTALLALEEGEPGAMPVRLVLGNADPRLSEAFLDELARRVAERLKGRSG
jgi:hypothetical protein